MTCANARKHLRSEIIAGYTLGENVSSVCVSIADGVIGNDLCPLLAESRLSPGFGYNDRY